MSVWLECDYQICGPNRAFNYAIRAALRRSKPKPTPYGHV